MSVAGMPWEWGDEMFIDGSQTQEDRQHTVNIYTGILAAMPMGVDACNKWGAMMWNTFQWCVHLGLRPYRVVFDEYSTNYVTDWNLQSPDGTIWTPTLTTGSLDAPVFTWVSGSGTKSTITPVVVQTDPWQMWNMSIDNLGVVTLTSATHSGEVFGAAMRDDNDKVWYFYMNRFQAPTIADDTPYTRIPYLRKAAFELTFIPTSTAKASPVNQFVLGRVGTDVARRIPAWWRWWVPEVDYVQHTRTAIEYKITASEDINIREVVGRVQTKRHKRRR